MTENGPLRASKAPIRPNSSFGIFRCSRSTKVASISAVRPLTVVEPLIDGNHA